jgi:hypothetical protein
MVSRGHLCYCTGAEAYFVTAVSYIRKMIMKSTAAVQLSSTVRPSLESVRVQVGSSSVGQYSAESRPVGRHSDSLSGQIEPPSSILAPPVGGLGDRGNVVVVKEEPTAFDEPSDDITRMKFSKSVAQHSGGKVIKLYSSASEAVFLVL